MEFKYICCLVLTVLVACSGCLNKTGNQTDADETKIPNPASVYCEEQGGTVEIVTAPDGDQVGFCILEDGTECEEWDFYRGECPI
ncbi:MAG: DUF333 domain-containing protein [Candidatus Nanohalarchaeota archaeon]|nr:MAG: DUF333 domain-containing protein [Candidatus Nanohaloarchaeota archaeon]